MKMTMMMMMTTTTKTTTKKKQKKKRKKKNKKWKKKKKSNNINNNNNSNNNNNNKWHEPINKHNVPAPRDERVKWMGVCWGREGWVLVRWRGMESVERVVVTSSARCTFVTVIKLEKEWPTNHENFNHVNGFAGSEGCMKIWAVREKKREKKETENNEQI